MVTISMTPEELKRLIEDTIDERLTRLLGNFEITDQPDSDSDLTWDEIRAQVERARWTPPRSAKSSLDLLREDRDS